NRSYLALIFFCLRNVCLSHDPDPLWSIFLDLHRFSFFRNLKSHTFDSRYVRANRLNVHGALADKVRTLTKVSHFVLQHSLELLESGDLVAQENYFFLSLTTSLGPQGLLHFGSFLFFMVVQLLLETGKLLTPFRVRLIENAVAGDKLLHLLDLGLVLYDPGICLDVFVNLGFGDFDLRELFLL